MQVNQNPLDIDYESMLYDLEDEEFINSITEDYYKNLCLDLINRGMIDLCKVDSKKLSNENYIELCISSVKKNPTDLWNVNYQKLTPSQYLKIAKIAIKNDHSKERHAINIAINHLSEKQASEIYTSILSAAVYKKKIAPHMPLNPKEIFYDLQDSSSSVAKALSNPPFKNQSQSSFVQAEQQKNTKNNSSSMKI